MTSALLIGAAVLVAAALAVAAWWRKPQVRSGAVLRGYGAVIIGDEVLSGRGVVGQLAGAVALVTDENVIAPGIAVAGAPGDTRAVCITIAFADGSVHTRELNDAAEIQQARVWAARFNALAGTAGSQSD